MCTGGWVEPGGSPSQNDCIYRGATFQWHHQAVEAGDAEAASRLLPYEELKRIAAHKMAGEREGHTLQPTALVHEAYLRLLGPDGEQRTWDSRGHFFAAAAEAMRRILIENARRKVRVKRGGDMVRVTWEESQLGIGPPSDELVAVDEALKGLEEEEPKLAEFVKLRYFAGLTVAETASVLGISSRTVNPVSLADVRLR